MRNRSRSVLVRYSDDEYKKLMDYVKSTGLSLQRYMLNASMQLKMTSDKDRELLKEQACLLADIDKQLRGIGTNINQLARNSNGYGDQITADDLSRLHSDYCTFREKVSRLWQSRRQSVAQASLMEECVTVSNISSEIKK